jgi:DNA-binding NarL/FixJ family response regulator
VAIVEDDAVLAHLLEEVCRTSGYEIVGRAREGGSAVSMVDHERPDCLLLGYDLGSDLNGLEVIERVKRRHPSIFTVMITAWDINDIASRIDRSPPDRILRKPVHTETLVKVLAGAERARR